MTLPQGPESLHVFVRWIGADGWNDNYVEDIAPYILPETMSWDAGEDIVSQSLNGITPSRLKFTLLNTDGRFSPGNPDSPLNNGTIAGQSVGEGRCVNLFIDLGFDSDNANLSSLTLSGVTFFPLFNPGTTDYTATVDEDLIETTVSAVMFQDDATIVITPADDDAGTAGHQVDLDIGDTDVVVTVTAEDGTTKAYTVAITRPDPNAPSTNANLHELALSGITLFPVFDPATTHLHGECRYGFGRDYGYSHQSRR